MEKPCETVCVIDGPIVDPEDKTVTTYEFRGPLGALRGVTIAVSREVELPVLLAHLQRMWDRETRQAQNSPLCTETGSAPCIP